jgi:hypothetical protein
MFQPTTHAELESSPADTPFSVSHFVHTLYAYRAAIRLSLLAVGLMYLVIALSLYLLAPGDKITSQRFRLDFAGASDGHFPNGIHFTPTDIVNSPILLRVYQKDGLSRYLDFGTFSRSMYVLEANEEHERIAQEYEARLSDQRLNIVDRERIEREFQLRLASVKKSDYSINYSRTNSGVMPDAVARKVLSDTLLAWADFAINEQQVLSYAVSLPAPESFDVPPADPTDYIVNLQILRLKTYRALQSLDDLAGQPGAPLVRTPDGMSVADVHSRLEEVLRYRVEPLVGIIRASGLIRNLPATVDVLNTQLAFDQRALAARQTEVETKRQAIALLTSSTSESVASAQPAQPSNGRPGSVASESVMPQLSDSFIDRLMSITTNAGLATYRRDLIDGYVRASNNVIPASLAVDYDKQALSEVENGSALSLRYDPATVEQMLERVRKDIRYLVVKTNELHAIMSRNISPTSQLMTFISPPVTRVVRAQSLARLVLFGVLVELLATPIVIIFCLLHNRVREEDEREEITSEGAVATV